MARILPAEFDAQYGVTISIFDSHASTLEMEAFFIEFIHFPYSKLAKKYFLLTAPLLIQLMDLDSHWVHSDALNPLDSLYLSSTVVSIVADRNMNRLRLPFHHPDSNSISD